MGKDKVESMLHARRYLALVDDLVDEDLIKYAWPQDVWFHVDKLSSAHVYLRMPDGMSWEDIPQALLTDCAQLVKANSIEGNSLSHSGYIRYSNLLNSHPGNKKENLTIIYTPADNLKVGTLSEPCLWRRV